MSSDNIAADQLRLLIERIERLEEEKKGISDDIKDVYLEGKATGFDVKTMRNVVRLRKLEKNARMEASTLLALYLSALGMDEDEMGGLAAPMPQARAHSVSAVPSEDEAALYPQAVMLVTDNGKASASWLQRQLRIGYNSAAGLIERMEADGLISAPNHVGARMVLVPAEKAA